MHAFGYLSYHLYLREQLSGAPVTFRHFERRPANVGHSARADDFQECEYTFQVSQTELDSMVRVSTSTITVSDTTWRQATTALGQRRPMSI